MSQSRHEHEDILSYHREHEFREVQENSVSLSDYLDIHYESTNPQKVINFLLKTLASSAFSAFLALALTCIVIVGILAFAANPITVALLPLLPVIFITAAWTGAGIGGGIGAFCTAIQNIKMERASMVGWFGIGIGLMGTLATAGAVVGTFIPVPVLGTLVGAASGAVMGVLIGAAAWAVSGIVGAIVTAYQKNRYDMIIGDDDGFYQENRNNSEYSDDEINENSFSNQMGQAFNKFTTFFAKEDVEIIADQNNDYENSSNYKTW
jgi:hypothetical protein